eukprot:9879889-Alexandrium_andersonii.AAC.1
MLAGGLPSRASSGWVAVCIGSMRRASVRRRRADRASRRWLVLKWGAAQGTPLRRPLRVSNKGTAAA